MKIQFNTGVNIKGSENVVAPFEAMLSEELKRFSSQITRLEVHLSDEDGDKSGVNDKRCMIEARLEGMQPIAVTNYANTNELAVEGATEKLISSLETILGRLESKNR